MIHAFQFFGKMVTVGGTKPPDKSKKAPWFNAECRAAEDEFLEAKRQFKFSANEANKLAFLDARKHFNLAKKRAKRHFNHIESKRMIHLSKTAPKQFWRHVNSYRKGKKAAAQDVTIVEFAEHFKNLSKN